MRQPHNFSGKAYISWYMERNGREGERRVWELTTAKLRLLAVLAENVIRAKKQGQRKVRNEQEASFYLYIFFFYFSSLSRRSHPSIKKSFWYFPVKKSSLNSLDSLVRLPVGPIRTTKQRVYPEYSSDEKRTEHERERERIKRTSVPIRPI